MIVVQYPERPTRRTRGGTLRTRTYTNMDSARRFMERQYTYWCRASCIGWMQAERVRIVSR